jgi:heme/copper-type cytochrome/quinol oxidase subunit 2
MFMPYLSPTDVTILVLVGAGLIALYWGYRARKSSRMPPEKRTRVFKYGRLAGLVMIVLGLGAYGWEIMSPITPEKIVQAERRRVALPMDIDAITRWDSVEAAPQRVIYTYTVRRIPRDRDGLANALRQQITQSVCADQVYQAAVKQHISFEFVYKFTDESYPAITLSPGECTG